jgi:hypothetical protein
MIFLLTIFTNYVFDNLFLPFIFCSENYRMENVELKKISGIAKILGVVLCLAGVLVLAFYEGPNLKSVNHRPFLHASKNKQVPHSKAEWIIGTFILIFFAIAWSLWMILQVGGGIVSLTA